MATVTDEFLSAFDGFSGLLLRPGDPAYEEARRVYNAMVDKHPALIAQCRSVADVVYAVNAARVHGLEVSVRGGGHSVAGDAVADGALMIDLSPMKGIDVDPAGRTARVEPGVTWQELNRETQLHGLAVPGGVVSTTGIAGLTLGGGIGWIMGKHGLACDNLISAQVVTAAGNVVTASEEEHEDLFWALRGGGGNFGIVTSFEYRLHPVGPTVTGGLVVHPYDTTRELLRFYRRFTAQLVDELAVDAALVYAPDGSGRQLAAMYLCHIGPPEQAERDIAPLLAFGSPAEVQVEPMPYAAVNAMLDEAYPPGALNYWKSSFLRDLSDDAIDAMVAAFTRCPSPMSAIVVERFHGQVTRVPVTATAFPHREPGYNFVATSVWLDAAASDENVAWTRETFAAMEPFLARGRYANYFSADDLGDDPVRAAFGPNHDRLVQVKTAYDPTNFFHLNLNIQPRSVNRAT